jgi:hypothetical protein
VFISMPVPQFIPTMFARVARDQATPEDAVRAAQAEIARIFERRDRSLG